MKRRTILITGAAIILCVGAVAGIMRLAGGRGKTVDVTKVSYLNNNWWDSTTSSGGYITTNASQEVYLSSDSIVDKVHVKVGDEVKIGDVLLDYDKTLLELTFDEEKLEGQILELELKGAKSDLEHLKGITPIPDSEGETYTPNFDDFEEPGDDDWGDDDGGDDDEAAVVIPNRQVLVTTSAEGTDGGSGVPTESEGGTQPEEGSGTDTEPSKPDESESTAPQTPPTETPETQAPEGAVTPPSDNGGGKDEIAESPLAKTKAYKRLNYKTNYYKGSGTKEDPYIYLCKEGAVIEASFMNRILGFNADATSRKKGGVNKDGKGCYAVLEIRNGDSLAGGFMRSVTINGTVATDKPYAPDVTWTFTSLGVTKNEPDIPEDPQDDGDDYFDDPGVWDDGEDVYTVTELKYAIEEKEKEIKELELDIKDAQISINKAQRDMDNATVKATINGVVKEIGDPAVGQIEGEPFMTLTSNKGMYVKGTISEMDLGTITVGSVVSGMAQESGMSITAEITEISEYPSEGNGFYYGGESNPNASSYPFIAYVDDSEELINHEWVDLQIQGNVQTGNSIFLPKALVRSENGQSYVYIADENKRLIKQYVRTGKTMYSTYIEVKDGLTEEDWIAFPYGKNVKEGVPVNELEGSGFADQMYY